jgi:hypothetical protein
MPPSRERASQSFAAVTRRRVLIALAIGVVAVAIALYMFLRDTYVPEALASYDLSSDSREVTVAFCGSTNETVIFQRAREDDGSVVIDLRLWVARNVFFNGTAHRVTFTLAKPLGDRVVTDGSGRAVPRGAQFLCPR